MLDILLWYVLLLAVGWLAFPIAFRLLKDLPDRGFALAKPLGLLLWGFVFWLLASLHIVGNDTGRCVVCAGTGGPVECACEQGAVAGNAGLDLGKPESDLHG